MYSAAGFHSMILLLFFYFDYLEKSLKFIVVMRKFHSKLIECLMVKNLFQNYLTDKMPESRFVKKFKPYEKIICFLACRCMGRFVA